MVSFSYKPLWMIKQRDSMKIVLLLGKWEIIRRLHRLAEFGKREKAPHSPKQISSQHDPFTPLLINLRNVSLVPL